MSSNTVTNKKKMKIGMLMIFFMQVSILDNHLSLLSKKKNLDNHHAALLFGSMATGMLA